MWLRNELCNTLLDELAPDRLESLGYFNSTVIQALIDDHFTHRHNHESTLWALLCFSTWHRMNCEQRLTTREYQPTTVSRG